MKKNYTLQNTSVLKSLLWLVILFIAFNAKSQNVTVSGAVAGNGSYPDLASAFAAINAGTQTNANISVLLVGNTTETTSAVLNAGAWTTLSVSPSGGNFTVTGNISGPLVDLNGADFVSINGLNSGGNALTLSNTNTLNVSTATIRFINDATFNTVTKTTLQGSGTSITLGTVLFSTGSSSGNSNNIISFCDIGPSSAGNPVNGVYSSGTASFENKFNSIQNCNIFDFFSASLVTMGIQIAANNSNWSVISNRLYQTTTKVYTTANTHKIISISSGNAYTVSANVIGYSSAAATGSYNMQSTVATRVIAIELSVANATLSSVQANTVSAISLTTSSGATTTNGIICGINIIGTSYASVGTSAGNVIGGTSGTDLITAYPTTTQGMVVGINCSSTSSVAIQNNYVGGLTSSGVTAAVAGGIAGIMVSGNSANLSVISNTLGNPTPNNMRGGTPNLTTGSSIVSGINMPTTSTGTIVVSNNIVQNFYSYGSGTAGYVRGIWTAAATGATATYSITGNLVTNLSTNSGLTTITSGQTAALGINPSTGTGNVVSNNTITNVACTGTATTASYAVGITAANATSSRIFNNRIYNISNSGLSTTATAPAIAAGIIVRSGTTDITIYNNFISLGAASTDNTAFVGIQFNHGSTPDPIDKVYYNTIVIGGTVTTGAISSFGIHRGDFTATLRSQIVDLRNNLIVNTRTGGTGNHLAIGNNINNAGSATGWAAGASNYNIFTCATNTIGYWNGALQTLTTWQASTSCDANSFANAAVTFVNSNNDLHLNMGTTANLIESNAQAISGITTDIDGQTRPGPSGSLNGGGLTPDIGADEFDGAILDIAAPAITYTPLSGACSTGDRTLTATISDYSGVATTGTLRPTIYYKKNAGTYFSALGTLASGNSTLGVWNFPISSSAMSGLASNDVVSYFVIAQDLASTVNIGSNPSAGLVAVNVASVTTTPTAPNSYVVASLSGTYTIGSAGNFTSITAAANAYNISCLAGPVTFRLIDALYSTNETFPIVFQNNASASATNSLLIVPATGTAVAITPTLTTISSVIKFLNARYITLDGLNTGGSALTINNSNTSSASANIWLASSPLVGPGCNSIAIKNLTAVGGSTAQSSGVIASVDGTAPSATGGADNDNITISGNTFLTFFNGILAVGTATSSAGALDNWLITGNTMGPAISGTNNLSGSGVAIVSALNFSLSSNLVQNIVTTSSGVYGLNINNSDIGFTISQNTLSNLFSSASSSGVNAIAGIYLGGGVSTGTVSRNNIYTIVNTNTSGYGAKGFIINTGIATSNINIQNNFISDVYCFADVSTIYSPMGFDIEGTTGGLNIDFNTVNLFGSHTGFSTGVTLSHALYNGSTAGNINIRNNIFSNTYDNSSSTTDINYAIYSAGTATNYPVMNYNNYYVGGTGNVPSLAYLGGNLNTMSALQNAFGQNLNSINFQPAFTSTVDLHLVASAQVNAALNNTGLSIAGISNDIDSQTRSSSAPDIGADEFTASATCTSAVAGTLDVAPALFTLCATTTSLLLNSTNVSTGLGTTYNWMVSPTPGGTYTNVAAASGTNLTYFSTLANGTYYFVLKATCAAASLTAISNEATVTIGAPNPTVALAAICGPASTATLNATGATSFTWSNGPTTFSNAVTQTATTVYTLAGTSACGSATNVITVVYSNPSVAATPVSPSVCIGQSAIINASGATTYSWNTGAVTASISVSPTVTTNYTLTGTDAYGCKNNVVQTITVNANPTVNIAGSTGICTGQTATLIASGANTYSWNTGATSNSITSTPVINTTYTVTGTSAQGCSTSTTQLVTVAASLSISIAGNSSICVGQSVNLSGSGGVTYTWNTGATTQTIAPSPTVTTTYSVIGASGTCSNTALKTITVNTNPTITVSGNSTICAGQTTTLTASGATTYSWLPSGSAASVAVSPTINSTYTVTGISSAGCSASLTTAVVSNSVPLITIAQSSGTVCASSPATFTASGASTYTWSTASNNTVISVTPTAAAIYTVTGTNPAGCISSKTVALGTYSLPVLSIIPASATVCSGVLTNFQAGGASTYTWNGSIVSATAAFNPTTNSIYTVSGTNSFSCTSTTTVGVTTNSLPVVSILPVSVTVCALSSANFTANGASTYLWNNTTTGSVVSLFQTSSTVHTVVGTNALGCSTTATVGVTTTPLPTITLSPSFTTVCAFSSLTVGATGALTYSWSTGSANSSITVSPGSPTVYAVTGTDALGCSSTSLAIIVTNTLPVIAVTPGTATICALDALTLTASGALSYTWSNGPVSATTVVTPSASTIYTVSGTDLNNGCTGTQTVAIAANPLPVITVVASSASVCPGSNATLTAFGASTYTWLVSGSSGAVAVVNPTVASVYTISATNTIGCTGTKTVNMDVYQLPVINTSPSAQTICVNEVATYSASGATTYTWMPGNVSGSVFTVSPTFFTQYTVTGTDANGCDNFSTFNLAVSACAGIKSVIGGNAGISVYPNPSVGSFTTKFEFEGRKHIEIFNELGQAIELRVTEHQIENFDLSDYSKGVYYVKVKSANASGNYKLVIQ